jgi:hypothetical protein
MTTYTHHITVDDGEMIALKEAISRYMDVCKEELASGPKAPFLAHLQSLERISDRLYADTGMTSTSSPCWPDLSSVKLDDK